MLDNSIAVIEGDTHASKWIEEQGKLEYDPTIEKVLMPLLSKSDNAVDVGAMLGAYAHGFKRAVGNGNVFAFEPNPESFRCLKINCPSVLCYNFAIGSKTGVCSLKPNEIYPDNYGATEVTVNEHGTVQVMALDDLFLQRFGPVKLLKIDVEGMEPEVIEGGIDLITRCRPIIFTEINHQALCRHAHTWHDVVGPLLALGYKPKFLGEGHSFIEQEWPQLDVLLMP